MRRPTESEGLRTPGGAPASAPVAAPATWDALDDLLASDGAATWVFTGDSITHGLTHTRGQRSYVEHVQEVLRGELARTRDVVVNTGVSAHRLSDVLADADRRITDWRPQVVVLMTGTNDCATHREPRLTPGEFADQLAEFVELVRDTGAVPILQTPPPLDVELAPERARLGVFAEVVRAKARATGVRMVDQYVALGGDGGPRLSPVLYNDPTHPNGAGHAVMALEFLSTLGVVDQAPHAVAHIRRLAHDAW